MNKSEDLTKVENEVSANPTAREIAMGYHAMRDGGADWYSNKIHIGKLDTVNLSNENRG